MWMVKSEYRFFLKVVWEITVDAWGQTYCMPCKASHVWASRRYIYASFITKTLGTMYQMLIVHCQCAYMYDIHDIGICFSCVLTVTPIAPVQLACSRSWLATHTAVLFWIFELGTNPPLFARSFTPIETPSHTCILSAAVAMSIVKVWSVGTYACTEITQFLPLLSLHLEFTCVLYVVCVTLSLCMSFHTCWLMSSHHWTQEPFTFSDGSTTFLLIIQSCMCWCSLSEFRNHSRVVHCHDCWWFHTARAILKQLVYYEHLMDTSATIAYTPALYCHTSNGSCCCVAFILSPRGPYQWHSVPSLTSENANWHSVTHIACK